MLITTDANWLKPEWPGAFVRVLFPEQGARPVDIAAFRKTGVVFEFTRRDCSLAVIRAVLDRMAHHLQRDGHRLFFSKTQLDPAALKALSDRIAADPWLVEYETDPIDGDLTMLAIGGSITSQPLFVTFFRNLTHIQELDAETVIESLKSYLGSDDAVEGDAQ